MIMDNNFSGGMELPMPHNEQPFAKHYSFVEGHNNLVRDEVTNAILNTNISEYENYLQLKSIKEKENSRIENLENNINNLKGDLDEIKNLIKSLLK